jgi:hypothetical protein
MRMWAVTVAMLVGVLVVNGVGMAVTEGAIVTETVKYRSGDETVSGYLARPKGDGLFPAIVVIHEWWGLVDWIKENARKFAERGYVALAVDLYRGASRHDARFGARVKSGLADGSGIAGFEIRRRLPSPATFCQPQTHRRHRLVHGRRLRIATGAERRCSGVRDLLWSACH